MSDNGDLTGVSLLLLEDFVVSGVVNEIEEPLCLSLSHMTKEDCEPLPFEMTSTWDEQLLTSPTPVLRRLYP